MAMLNISHQQELRIRRFPELCNMLFRVTGKLTELHKGATAAEVQALNAEVQSLINAYDLTAQG